MIPSNPPERIESYRIRRPLGTGGMGLVFEAVHEILGTEVAIKLAASHVRRDPTLRARFLNEARALAQVNHPGIVRILGCGQIDVSGEEPILYIIMELLRGKTLRARLSNSLLSIEESRQIGLQIAEALCEVHRHHLVHRDIKPENIILLDTDSKTDPGRAKIIDFGIAKVPSPSQPVDALTPGTEIETGGDASLGTPGYMSPEQCKDASTTTAESDVYALGVVLYEMLAGRPPFEAPTRVELLTRHIKDAPAALTRGREQVPPRFRKLVMRLLAKSPSTRPRLEDVCKALQTRTLLLPGPRRGLLALVITLAVFAIAAALGREHLANWTVERELQGVQPEAGSIFESKRSVSMARRWLLFWALGTSGPPLARARIHHKEADLDQEEGHLESARDNFTQALSFYSIALQRCSDKEGILRDRMAATSNELAQVLRHLGQDQAAAEYFDRGIREHDRLALLPRYSERQKYLRTLVLYRRAELAADMADPQSSLLFRALHQTLKSLHDADPNNANVCWHLSRVLIAEAALWARSGQGSAAKAQAETALQLVQEARRLAPGWKRPRIAEVEQARSSIYEALGDKEAARASLHAAYSRWQETVAEEPRGAYRHAWLLLCIRGAKLQEGSLRDIYLQTAVRLIHEFDREGIYQGDVHVSQARAWLEEARRS